MEVSRGLLEFFMNLYFLTSSLAGYSRNGGGACLELGTQGVA